jgi:hypothetical protein
MREAPEQFPNDDDDDDDEWGKQQLNSILVVRL